MPSSLTRVRSSAWVCATHPPVAVCGTGRRALPQHAFRGRPGVGPLRRPRGCHSCSLLGTNARLAAGLPTSLNVPRLHADHPPRHRAGVKQATPGAGLSTCCPSPTPCGLGLGPTNPLRSDRAAETLDLRRWGFAPHESLLIPTFALVPAPPGLPVRLHGGDDAPLPCHSHNGILRFGGTFSPGELSARAPSTSELLRTLSRMAASKPTSWLSGRAHLLAH